MKKSAPQPAIRKTPTGGTVHIRLVSHQLCIATGMFLLVQGRLTEDGDNDE